MSLPQLKLDRQFCFLVYRLEHKLMGLYRPLLGPLGLTYPQYLALLVLWEKGPLGVASLASALYLDTGTISPLVKRMEKLGLVTRLRQTQDERQVLVTLTDKGRALEAQAADIPGKLLSCLPPLPGVDPAQVFQNLKTLVEAV